MSARRPPGPPGDTEAPAPSKPSRSKPKPPPAPVELETPTGRIIARVMPARGQDAAGRWYWRARRSVAGKQADVWTGRAHRPEVLDELAAIAAGLAPSVSDRRRGEPAAPRTVGDLLDRWIAERVEGARDLAPNTRRGYGTRAAALRATLAHVALSALAVRHLDAHRATRERAGAASGTVWTELKALTAALRWGADRGFVERDFPTLPFKVRHKQGRTPTAAEVARVIAQAPPRVALALEVQAATGARIGEVLALRFADIEIDHEASEGVLHFGRVEGARKTGARTVPICGPVVESLRSALCPGAPGGPWGPYSGSVVQSFFRRIDWTEAGCEPFTSHGIRRMVADTFARAGVEVATAANILGHSVTMMLTVYRRVTDGDRALAVRQAGLGTLAAGNVVSLAAARQGKRK